ncbi:WD40 repeat-containing protein, putative [Bodo saltans]|uniref:WD40 repeat-containing protein, putative n=1 Tax=Bodo saltans TaxID=75058 RepID=A0A0S4JTE0_BODSA|nr:WD40 repeat-containing protein, putative [Bodo saltans]|eukprot:CUG93854.1 WD40 repeat-containing protein, putative [Bodo saltans]
MSEQKEKLRFKIEGRSIVYEGLRSARKKDLMDILAKMAVADAIVVPTVRENLPEIEGSDADILASFEEAKRLRRERRSRASVVALEPEAAAPAAQTAPAPVPTASVSQTTSSSAPVAVAPAAAAAVAEVVEQKQRLTLTFRGKQFAYDGLPSKRESALLELIMKQGTLASDVVVATYRENIPETKNSDVQILALLEEARKAKAAKEEAKRAARHQQVSQETSAALHHHASSSHLTTSTSAPPQVVHHQQTPSAIDEIYAMSSKEKDVINEFINSVLSSGTPAAAVNAAKNVKATTVHEDPTPSTPPPAQRPQSSNDLLASQSQASASNFDSGPKITVYCQEEGTTTQRIIYPQRNISFEDFAAMVEKKIGHKTVLSFFEGEDKVEIDDGEVLQMFFDSLSDGRKLRLICSLPETRRVVADDKLTEFATPAAAAAPAQGATGIVAAPPPVQRVTKFCSSGVVSIEETRTFTGHSAAVYCCAFSPTGDKFCTASRDRSVRVWNTATGTCTTMRGGHNGFVLSCDFSPNGTYIVSSADDCSIKVWNVSTGAKTLSLKGHDDKVYCVQYNATGAYIVSGSCDRTVRVWNADSGTRQATLKGHDLAVFSCCFSNTDAGRFVASGSDDRLVKIWDWREGREVKNFIGHTGTVWSVQFSHTDKFIVSASMDHEIKLWDVASTSCVRTMTGHMTPIHHAIFTTDDKYLISCARDWMVMVWEVATGKKLETIQGHRNTVYHLAMCKDQLLTSSLDDSIKLWNFKDIVE